MEEVLQQEEEQLKINQKKIPIIGGIGHKRERHESAKTAQQSNERSRDREGRDNKEKERNGGDDDDRREHRQMSRGDRGDSKRVEGGSRWRKRDYKNETKHESRS